MRNMNQSKRKWTPAALACALVMMAMLAAAPAWAYTALVHNTTEETVWVEVFEATFMVIGTRCVGKKRIDPGGVADFKTHGGLCIDHYKGSYTKRDPTTGEIDSQKWKSYSSWACKLQHAYVKRRKNGKFYFEIP